MRHVREEVGAGRVGDRTHTFVVDEPAVGGGASYDDLGTV